MTYPAARAIEVFPEQHCPTGGRSNRESRNDYYRARYYSSNDARFLTPDPSGLMYAQLTNPQSLNLYNYVGNDPLSRVDLMGLCWKGFKWACDLGHAVAGFVKFFKPAPVHATVTTSNGPGTVAPSGRGKGNPPDKGTCKTGFNFGGTVGADGGAGLGFNPLQMAALAGGAAGFTLGGKHPVGAFAADSVGGAVAGHGFPSQKENMGAVGGGAAVGVGITFGNATSAGQMRGNALTFGGGVDAGVGGGAQITFSNDAAGNLIWQVNITGGVGYKFYAYSLETHTKAVSTNPGC